MRKTKFILIMAGNCAEPTTIEIELRERPITIRLTHLYTCMGSAIGRDDARADRMYSLIQGYAYVLNAKPVE